MSSIPCLHWVSTFNHVHTHHEIVSNVLVRNVDRCIIVYNIVYTGNAGYVDVTGVICKYLTTYVSK